MKKILSLLRQAIQTYNMIETGDVIAIAVSGGKDSLMLLKAMHAFKSFYTVQFDIKAVSIDIGFENADFDKIKAFCEKLEIEYRVEKTQIKEIVFDRMQKKSPCALCAKMRRAALCSAALSMGCNKIALGHNQDDAVETFMMNVIHVGKAMCFEPVTHYEDTGISLIRPLIFVPEYIIKKCAADFDLPIMKKICPADGNTKREETKTLIKIIRKENKNAGKNIFTAIRNLPEFKKYETGDRL